jgi:3-hydroxyacyl-CoA dehydrogenase/enoyl-CoA hydratase/3-hydroxybutyryl-CoA epimerase
MTGPHVSDGTANAMPNAVPNALLTVTIEDGVAVVIFDTPDAPINTLGPRVAAAFAALFDRLERDVTVRAAVLLSGKADTWIAGADIDQFANVHAAADGERLSREGHALLDRLERLRFPVVAAINGACLGGGLEVALACAWRIATEHPKTAFAFPEVQLGLIPGAGGTQRLPRLVGLQAALDMILTGKNVRPRTALSMGLIDELLHPAVVREVAIERARSLAADEARGVRRGAGHKRPHGATTVLLEDNPIGRAVVFRQAREQVLKRTRGHYPAPLAAIDVVHTGYADGMEAGLREEARRFGELMVTDVSRQLVGIFFATTALKKDPGVDPPVAPRAVRALGVVGAGFMGAGIAALAAQQGTTVRLKDADPPHVGKGLAAARALFEERLRRRRIARFEFENLLALVSGTVDYAGFARLDLVIEAVFEDAALKRRVIDEVERAAPNAIIASNTSTIPITQLAEQAAHPERVVGMHFFSPVHKMPLLEVVVGERTGAEATATAVAYGKRIGKTVIVVRDGPGFYVNRILTPYVNEAGRLLDEGVGIDAIDRALVGFGFPVGPITLVDEVGLDIAGKSGAIMSEAFPDRMMPAQSLRRVLESGRLGRKGKQGFYRYDEAGKKGAVDESVYALLPTGSRRIEVPSEEIVRRTVLPMLDEAVRCLEGGVLRLPRDGDVGAVFGIGFPPFRGGPFRYLDTLGAGTVVRALDELAARFPGRFSASDMLRRMASSGARFY